MEKKKESLEWSQAPLLQTHKGAQNTNHSPLNFLSISLPLPPGLDGLVPPGEEMVRLGMARRWTSRNYGRLIEFRSDLEMFKWKISFSFDYLAGEKLIRVSDTK